MNLQPTRQTQEQQSRAALRIPIPLGVTQLQTTNTTIYTARDDADCEIGGLILTDVTNGPESFSLWFVPSGGSASDANAAEIDLAIAANSTARLTEYDGLFLAPGTSIVASCSTNDSVNLLGWVYEYQGIYS